MYKSLVFGDEFFGSRSAFTVTPEVFTADATFRQYPHAAAAETHARAFSASVQQIPEDLQSASSTGWGSSTCRPAKFSWLVSAGQRVGDDDL